MTFAHCRITLAYAGSLVLHLVVLFGGMVRSAPSIPPEPPPLMAKLKFPAPALAPEPELIPPAPPAVEPPPPPPPPPKQTPPRSTAPRDWQSAARQQLQKMSADGLLYSPEAIAAGLQGTAVVLLILDESGKVTATRIEESSGHPLLDRDARNAAMRLRFPPDAPGEIVYPIRFRLK